MTQPEHDELSELAKMWPHIHYDRTWICHRCQLERWLDKHKPEVKS